MAQVSTTSKQSVAQSVPTKDRFGMRRARGKQLWATTKERATHVHNYNYMALRHNHLIQPLPGATAQINRRAKLQPTTITLLFDTTI